MKKFFIVLLLLSMAILSGCSSDNTNHSEIRTNNLDNVLVTLIPQYLLEDIDYVKVDKIDYYSSLIELDQEYRAIIYVVTDSTKYKDTAEFFSGKVVKSTTVYYKIDGGSPDYIDLESIDENKKISTLYYQYTANPSKYNHYEFKSDEITKMNEDFVQKLFNYESN